MRRVFREGARRGAGAAGLSVAVTVETVGYKEDDAYGLWKNGELTVGTLGSFADRKFVHGTWLDFFETYIVPSVSPHIVYNAPVRSIDYSGDAVIVRTHDAKYTADAVIVTAPLPMIKNGTIAFVPALPRHKARAARRVVVWGGIKVFLEFSAKFYPTYTDFAIRPKRAGHRMYFDAAVRAEHGETYTGTLCRR
ncbi:MAG: FAD-dependent oxidoreductase [Firmicutes bacterium]|nr:FAD-dependent oxidoreductase [Bacillota bacterium]